MRTECFITQDIIYLVYESGGTSFPGPISIDRERSVVNILDADGYVVEECTLHDSVLALALAIEGRSYTDDSFECAVMNAHHDIELFRQQWMDNHKKLPSSWPLSLPPDNIGLYYEQIANAVLS